MSKTKKKDLVNEILHIKKRQDVYILKIIQTSIQI